jgi:hypothetical protein
VPGFVLIAGVFAWEGVELFRTGFPALKDVSVSVPHLSMTINQPLAQAGWVALAGGISLASWLLARKLAGRRDAL